MKKHENIHCRESFVSTSMFKQKNEEEEGEEEEGKEEEEKEEEDGKEGRGGREEGRGKGGELLGTQRHLSISALYYLLKYVFLTFMFLAIT